MCAHIVRSLPDTARWTFTRFLSGNFISLDHKETFPPKGDCHFMHSRPRSSLVSSNTRPPFFKVRFEFDCITHAQREYQPSTVSSLARRCARLCTVVLLRLLVQLDGVPVFAPSFCCGLNGATYAARLIRSGQGNYHTGDYTVPSVHAPRQRPSIFPLVEIHGNTGVPVFHTIFCCVGCMG